MLQFIILQAKSSIHVSNGNTNSPVQEQYESIEGGMRKMTLPALSPSKLRTCPECGASRLMDDQEQGELVCLDCGYVVDDKISDRGPEWRAYNNEQREKRTRVGSPLTYTMHDKGLSTFIDHHDQDIQGRTLHPKQASQIFMLRRWQRKIRIADSSERNLALALSEMNRISSSLTLPQNILETGAIFYRKALKNGLTRGKSIQGFAAAALYMACRKSSIPRTLEEISRLTTVEKKKVARYYRSLVEELNEHVPLSYETNYISKLSNQLQLPGKVETIAASIIEAAKDLHLTCGRGTAGIAAAAIYIASLLTRKKRAQREIAKPANITEITVRHRYKEIMSKLEIKIRV